VPELPAALRQALADRYALVRELGQGGMATVYLAQDLRHQRQVAVKVLRPELSAVIGADRFLSEIRTTANLQHPHILPLFDSGVVQVGRDGRESREGLDAEGSAPATFATPATFLYYVMPFVEGVSLRDRLSREKQLPVAEALRIATEVASALDYAHRHGVVHRDIKPENILLHDGSALVADFGIALAASKSGGSRMTETGMSLGTPHYMSPEQAMGEREITGRSDIYALGVVTYEMLTGDPPFTGSTAQAIVARVMTEPPRSLTGQRHTIPESVEAAVLTALEKLPADRFASAADFAAALTDTRSSTRLARPGRRPRPARLLSAAAVLALLAGVTGFLLARRTERPSLPMEFTRSTRVTWEPGLEILPAISPDGRSVAYASGNMASMQIYVRPVSGGRSIRLTDDSTGVQSHPSWSPDGTRVLFLQNDGISSAPAAGGPARPEIPPVRSGPLAAAVWSPDGTELAWTARDSLFVRDASGRSRALAAFHEPNVCSWSPSGAFIACGSGNLFSLVVGGAFGNISPSSIVVCRVSDGRVTRVTDSVTVNQAPVWSPDSRWLYFVSSRHGPRDIYAQRMTGAGDAAGPPIRLTTGLDVHTFSLAADGRRLAFASLDVRSNVWTASLTDTSAAPVQVTTGSQITENVTVTADGRWLYYDSDLTGNMDLYRMRLPAGAAERLTTDPADDFAPELSPDGREVVFHSWRGGHSRDVYVMPLDGGPTQRVTDTPIQEALVTWSPDGNALAFCEFTANGGIWIARRVNGVWEKAVRRLDHGFWPVWSPDGRYLAFTTAVVDGLLGVVPVGEGTERFVMDPATAVPAARPVWSRDGASLLFRGVHQSGREMVYRVPVNGGTAPRPVSGLSGAQGAAVQGGWASAAGRAYFSSVEQQSDVSVIETVQ